MNSKTQLMTDKGLSSVAYCYPSSYKDKVYSLKLKNGDSFYADGVVSGSNDVMGELLETSSDDINVAVEPEILEECKAMEEDYRNDLI
jgi:hypothetical protein